MYRDVTAQPLHRDDDSRRRIFVDADCERIDDLLLEARAAGSTVEHTGGSRAARFDAGCAAGRPSVAEAVRRRCRCP